MALVRDISKLSLPFEYQIERDVRSLAQNALSFVWYKQIFLQGREMDTVDARRFCKLHFGVPIRCGSDPEYHAAWHSLIVPHHDYQGQIKLMDWWPVTRDMKPDEMSEYLTAMQKHFHEQGIILAGDPHGLDQHPEAQRG